MGAARGAPAWLCRPMVRVLCVGGLGVHDRPGCGRDHQTRERSRSLMKRLGQEVEGTSPSTSSPKGRAGSGGLL